MSGSGGAERTVGGMVPALRSRLAERLEQIEAEAHAIKAAMRALDAPAKRRPGSGPESRAVPDVILRALAEAPGSRASMLALTTGLRPAKIASTLAVLESAGQVSRDGLGWSLTPLVADQPVSKR